jgi:hypothetical protein
MGRSCWCWSLPLSWACRWAGVGVWVEREGAGAGGLRQLLVLVPTFELGVQVGGDG